MKKYLIIATFLSIIGFAMPASASSLYFPPTQSTSLASSSVAFLSAGNGTSTISVDSYIIGVPTPQLRAALLIQYAATSTKPSLSINIQYSQDNIDWYQDSGSAENAFATSSRPFDLSQPSQFLWNFASSTQNLGALTAGNSATSTRIITLQTPTRYTRAIFTVPSGAGAGAVWAQWIPLKEENK